MPITILTTTTSRGRKHNVALTLLLFIARVTSFVPQTVHDVSHRSGPFTNVATKLNVVTEPRLTSTKEDDGDERSSRLDILQPSPSNGNSGGDLPKHNKRGLHLNKDGTLRLDETVILDGLCSTIWTGIEPSESDYSIDPQATSIFLKANHFIERSEHELTLGSLQSCHRLLACARVNRYWMGPAFGSSTKDIPHDTQFLMFELSKDGPYALFLPLVDSGFRATLQPSDNGDNLEVICFSESGEKSVSADGMLALHISVGDDPYKLLKQAFRQVADGQQTFETLDRKKVPSTVDDFGWCTWDAFYSKVTPEGIVDGVTALHEAGVPPRNVILDDGWQQVGPYPKDWIEPSDVKEKKRSILSFFLTPILNKIAQKATNYYSLKVQRASYGSFHNRVWSFLARTVLKSGLWDFFDTQTDFARQLNGFDPNFKFEKSQSGKPIEHGEINTLKEMVTKLKTELDVKNVYCWHAIHGYWRGISSELGEKIGIDVQQVQPKASKHVLKVDPQAEYDPPTLFGVGMITTEDDLDTFYKHIHAPLVEAGIDGVKVDVQSGVTAAGSGVGGGPHIARLYTQAMEKSVSKNFSNKGDGEIDCINCMCHSTENLYRYKVTSVARASEDFFPGRSESHSVHLVNVAYNSLFLGEICLPDWDMFHSLHSSAELHAAARSIGGCPVYVSDVPGQHNIPLLKKLVLPDGSTLRAPQAGRPTRDCLFADVGQDGTSALKIWNQNKAGGGVVGTFHVQGVAWDFNTNANEIVDALPPPITAYSKAYDVETLRSHDGPFAVWQHRPGSLSVLSTGDTTVDVSLDHREWDIFTFMPIETLSQVQWAPIGLGEMMNSGGAIEMAGALEETTIKSASSDNEYRSITADASVRGPGKFVAYCQPSPSSILINDGQRDISSDLLYAHDAESGLLTLELPEETGDRRPHRLTFVWDEAIS